MAGEIRDLTTKVGLTCPGVGHGDAGQVTCAPMTRRPTCTQGGKIFWCYAHQTAPTGKPFGIHHVSRAGNRLAIPIASSFHSSPLMAARTNSQPGACNSKPAQLALRDRPRLRRDQIAQAIRRIIAANAIIVRICLQNIFGPVRIMLQRRQSFQQATASLVNE